MRLTQTSRVAAAQSGDKDLPAAVTSGASCRRARIQRHASAAPRMAARMRSAAIGLRQGKAGRFSALK